MRRKSVLFLVLFIFVTGCAAQTTAPRISTMPTLTMPEYVQAAPERVQEAYHYAVTNPQELEKYPCYCGCVNIGHTSNLSCYVKSFDAKGHPTEFDNHASGCGVCIDITQDVIRLKADNLTSIKIREYIDQTYSFSGPGTNTPLPIS